MNKITEKLLKLLNININNEALNIRENGKSIKQVSSNNVKIVSKKDKNGINIYINKNAKNETIYIPVILTKSGYKEKVYNDFYIEEGAEVKIIAGCAIHNNEENNSVHEGVHTFYVGKNSKIIYIEEHLGNSCILTNKTINTITNIFLEDNAEFTITTIQKRGVNDANRTTNALLKHNSKLKIKEKLLTGNNDISNSSYNVDLNGKNSSLNITSKTIAKDASQVKFNIEANGNNLCFAHIECDAIIMNKAKVHSCPSVNANHSEANLTHEAAIGKIAKNQIEKLMSLGLTKKQAEDTIINSFIE